MNMARSQVVPTCEMVTCEIPLFRCPNNSGDSVSEVTGIVDGLKSTCPGSFPEAPIGYMAVGAAPPRQGCFYNRCPGLVRKHKCLLSAQITLKLRKQTLESPDPAYADASDLPQLLILLLLLLL